MSTRQRRLSKSEIRAAFATDSPTPVPPILSVAELSTLTGVARKTLYEWIGRGRLDGAFRKRGKHHLIWRDRAIEILFNDSEWK